MYSRLLITALAVIALTAQACKKGSSQTSTGLLTGKVILMACGTAAIDIEGTAGTGSHWGNETLSYNNAVTVNNYCYLAEKGIHTGDTVTFSISKENTEPGAPCAVTMCLIAGPENHVYITNLQKIKQAD